MGCPRRMCIYRMRFINGMKQSTTEFGHMRAIEKRRLMVRRRRDHLEQSSVHVDLKCEGRSSQCETEPRKWSVSVWYHYQFEDHELTQTQEVDGGGTIEVIGTLACYHTLAPDQVDFPTED